MKELSLAAAFVLIIILAILFWNSFDQRQVLSWNTWVNQVRIAGQPGSDTKVVRQMLGQPDVIEKPGSIGKGFLPQAPQVPGTREVYVYRKTSLGVGGYWKAYVFIGASGKVLGVHLANS